jgi:uroporphyrin-III C-methyltransferase/precorrin-2 dehydrogenase/sirohydrochlorin ferrochelatase
MQFLPIFKRAEGLPALVVGGGPVAERKVDFLLRAGADVTVVSPKATRKLEKLEKSEKIRLEHREFEIPDLTGKSIVFTATGIEEVDGKVAHAARDSGLEVCAVDNPDLSTFIVPSIVDRSPIMIAVSTGGSMPTLGREIRSFIESRLPSKLGVWAKRAGEMRAKIKRQFPDERARREFLTSQARQYLSGSGSYDNTTPSRGQVSIVGAGPGDPDLLTLKAVQKLQDADVILHDRLVSHEILEYGRRDAEYIDVGKAPGKKGYTQDQINALMAHLASQGDHVVRLKGGDPFIFGRGGEELAYLRRRGLSVDVVPGIIAALGCAAAEGISLTHRGVAQCVTLLTGTAGGDLAPQQWGALAETGGTLVAYMGASKASLLSSAMIEGGLDPDTPVSIIENGTR